jgi:hypothetical protein
MSEYTGMTATEQLGLMLQSGIDPVPNSWVAGRMPPGHTVGINPAEFSYSQGALSQQLLEQLGEPMINMRSSFGTASTAPSPSLTNEPTPRFILGND